MIQFSLLQRHSEGKESVLDFGARRSSKSPRFEASRPRAGFRGSTKAAITRDRRIIAERNGWIWSAEVGSLVRSTFISLSRFWSLNSDPARASGPSVEMLKSGIRSCVIVSQPRTAIKGRLHDFALSLSLSFSQARARRH